jgi:sirohydrochlorin ferrochelatase
MKPAILIVGHGSRDREGTHEFRQLVDLFEAQDPGRIVECGFGVLSAAPLWSRSYQGC